MNDFLFESSEEFHANVKPTYEPPESLCLEEDPTLAYSCEEDKEYYMKVVEYRAELKKKIQALTEESEACKQAMEDARNVYLAIEAELAETLEEYMDHQWVVPVEADPDTWEPPQELIDELKNKS